MPPCRRLRSALGAAVFLFLGAAAPPSFAQNDEDALIADRWEAMRSGAQSAIYRPLATVPGAAPVSPLPRAKRELKAEDAVQYAASKGDGALLVLHGRRIVLARYFGAATAETRFDSLSLHKTLVALLIGQAIAEGAIESAEAPLGRFIPEWSGDPRGAISLLDLLRMTGGVERQRLGPAPYNLETRMLFGDDVWGHALARGVAGPPGAVFYYNNVETQLLGIALERAVGVPYAEYLARTLWAPIGAGDAEVWIDRHGKPRVYCCLLARPQDWLRVGALLRDRGRSGGRQVLPAAWVEATLAPSPLNPGYGQQIWRGTPLEETLTEGVAGGLPRAEPFAVDDIVMLVGFGGQRVYISRRCDLVIVRNGAQTADWDDSVLPNAIIRALGPRACR